MPGVRFKMKHPENESRAKRENGWPLLPLELERLARRIFLEKQNSLKQLNLTREKIKKWHKEAEEEKTEGEGNIPLSRLSIMLLRRSLAFVKVMKIKKNIENFVILVEGCLDFLTLECNDFARSECISKFSLLTIL